MKMKKMVNWRFKKKQKYGINCKPFKDAHVQKHKL